PIEMSAQRCPRKPAHLRYELLGEDLFEELVGDDLSAEAMEVVALHGLSSRLERAGGRAQGVIAAVVDEHRGSAILREEGPQVEVVSVKSADGSLRKPNCLRGPVRDVARLEAGSAVRQAKDVGDLGAEPKVVGARLAEGKRRCVRCAHSQDRADTAGVVTAAESEADVPEAPAHRCVQESGELLPPFLDVAIRLGLERVAPASVRLLTAVNDPHRGRAA